MNFFNNTDEVANIFGYSLIWYRESGAIFTPLLIIIGIVAMMGCVNLTRGWRGDPGSAIKSWLFWNGFFFVLFAFGELMSVFGSCRGGCDYRLIQAFEIAMLWYAPIAIATLAYLLFKWTQRKIEDVRWVRRSRQ